MHRKMVRLRDDGLKTPKEASPDRMTMKTSLQDSKRKAELYSVEYWKAWKMRSEIDTNLSRSSSSSAISSTRSLNSKQQKKEVVDERLDFGRRVKTKPESIIPKDSSGLDVLSTKKRARTLKIQPGNRFKPLEIVETTKAYLQPQFGSNAQAVSIGNSTRGDWQNVLISKSQRDGGRSQQYNAAPGSYCVSQDLGRKSILSTSRTALQYEFSKEPRMKNTNVEKISHEAPGASVLNRSLVASQATSIKFGLAERFKSEGTMVSRCEGPGPDAYNQSSSFADSMGRTKGCLFAHPHSTPKAGQLLDTTRKINLPFGYGCILEEHVQYGQCVDGKCLERGTWEQHRKGGKEKRHKIHDSVKSAHHSNDSNGDEETSSSKVEASPLHFACAYNKLNVVIFLCSSGADRNALDENNCTPLHVACRKGYYEIAKYLIEAPTWIQKLRTNANRVNINEKNRQGETCLHLAVDSENHQLVQYLMEQGANATMYDNEGRQPIHRIKKNQQIYQLLKSFALKMDIKDKLQEMDHQMANMQFPKFLERTEETIQDLKQKILKYD